MNEGDGKIAIVWRIGEDGYASWFAGGVRGQTPDEVARKLGVPPERLELAEDPNLTEQGERERRRRRSRAASSRLSQEGQEGFWDWYHGRK